MIGDDSNVTFMKKGRMTASLGALTNDALPFFHDFIKLIITVVLKFMQYGDFLGGSQFSRYF